MSVFVSRRRELVLWAIMTLFCGVSGPFGSFVYLGVGDRVLYWGTQIGIAMIIGGIIEFIGVNYLGRFSLMTRDAVSTCVMTILFSPVVFALNAHFYPPEVLEGFRIEILIAGVFIITALTIGVWRAVNAYNAKSSDEGVAPKLLKRLEEDMGDIYALTANSHLVEVSFAQGVQTIRFRFSDAVDEMKPVEGVMVHRSHWVCKACIEEFFFDGKKLMVRLDNGSSYPVSATGRVNLGRIGIDVPS